MGFGREFPFNPKVASEPDDKNTFAFLRDTEIRGIQNLEFDVVMKSVAQTGVIVFRQTREMFELGLVVLYRDFGMT